MTCRRSEREMTGLRLVSLAGAPVLAVLLLALLTTPSWAQETPEHRRSSVWLPSWHMTKAYERVARNSDLFDVASPFWYDASTCSALTARRGAGSRTVILGLRAKGLNVVPTITGSGLGPRAALDCFSNARLRAAHIEQIAQVVTSHAYGGIDVDYEHLALTTDPVVAQKVRRAFSVFVEDLCDRMRSVNKMCVITVMPRTSDDLTVWRAKLIPGVYDYRAISASAARMRVMAYDQHAPNTAPGPIAGFPWVRQIVAYTVRKAPPGKVELGVPTYGRDWSGETAVTLSEQQAVSLARAHGLTPTFDPIQRELTFRYRAQGIWHEVWFSNPRAVAVRYWLARRKGMAGAAYWAAGLEQRGTWSAVRDR